MSGPSLRPGSHPLCSPLPISHGRGSPPGAAPLLGCSGGRVALGGAQQDRCSFPAPRRVCECSSWGGPGGDPRASNAAPGGSRRQGWQRGWGPRARGWGPDGQPHHGAGGAGDVPLRCGGRPPPEPSPSVPGWEGTHRGSGVAAPIHSLGCIQAVPVPPVPPGIPWHPQAAPQHAASTAPPYQAPQPTGTAGAGALGTGVEASPCHCRDPSGHGAGEGQGSFVHPRGRGGAQGAHREGRGRGQGRTGHAEPCEEGRGRGEAGHWGLCRLRERWLARPMPPALPRSRGRRRRQPCPTAGAQGAGPTPRHPARSSARAPRSSGSSTCPAAGPAGPPSVG